VERKWRCANRKNQNCSYKGILFPNILQIKRNDFLGSLYAYEMAFAFLSIFYYSYMVHLIPWNLDLLHQDASVLNSLLEYKRETPRNNGKDIFKLETRQHQWSVFFSFGRADKGDSIRFSYLRNLNQLNGGAVVGEMSRRFSTNENTLTVGCSYVVDPQTLLKAKLNNHGNLGALVQHELMPKSFLTISGAFDTKALQNTPKFGLALSLKPWSAIFV